MSWAKLHPRRQRRRRQAMGSTGRPIDANTTARICVGRSRYFTGPDFLSEISQNPEAIAVRTFRKNPRAFKRKTQSIWMADLSASDFTPLIAKREAGQADTTQYSEKSRRGATRPCRPLCKRRDAVKYLYPALVGDSHPFRGAELEHSEDMTKLPTAPRLVRGIAHNSRRQSASPSRCS